MSNSIEKILSLDPEDSETLRRLPGCAAPSSNPRETKTAIVTGRIERVLDLDADNMIIEAWRRNLLRPRQAFERSGLHYPRT
jgi:hypothetical protein